MDYVCYVLESTVSNRTYVGITNNLEKRLRQHNGEICGGAKYTHSCRPWKVYGYVKGFGQDKIRVLKFEWRWKYLSKKEKGCPKERRMKAVQSLLNEGLEFILI